MVLSMGLLAWSARTLPIGTAYAIWTGIGAAERPCSACISSEGRKRHACRGRRADYRWG
jgi:hypothetical protein